MSEIDPQIFNHIKETNQALGRIEENQKTTIEFAKAINGKIDNHVKDDGAHGIGIKEKTEQKLEKASDTNWNRVSTFVVAGAAAVDMLWHFMAK